MCCHAHIKKMLQCLQQVFGHVLDMLTSMLTSPISCDLYRLTVANLILEYVLANAAVARSFSGYFANLIGKDSTFFAVTPNDSLNLDFWAFGLVLAATALLCYSTRESSTFNLGAPAPCYLHLV